MHFKKYICLLLALLLCSMPAAGQKFGDFSTRTDRTTTSRTPVEASFVYDSFTNSNGTAITSHTGEIGAVWVKHPDSQYSSGSVLIQNNRAHSASGTTAYYTLNEAPSPDYSVSAIVHCVTALTSHSTGITGRMDQTANTFYSVRHNNGSTFTLIEVVAGSVQRTVTHNQALTAGQFASVELRMSGASIRMIVDGVDRGGWSDGVITNAGRPGMRFNGTQSSTTGYHIDNFQAFVNRPDVSARNDISFGQLPNLPLAEPDPTYPTTTGYSSYTVPGSFSTIQAAINASIDDVDGSGNFSGVEIILDKTVTHTVTTRIDQKKITVPNPHGRYIIIRTSDLAGLPARNIRATSAHASAMAKIVASGFPTSGSSSTIFRTEPGVDVSYYWFKGLEITASNTSVEMSRLVEWGDDGVTDVSNQAHHMVLDHSWVHGHDNLEVTRGLVLHAADSIVIDSSITEIHDRTNGDCQAINAINGGQRVLIQNNRLEASGENVLIGGGTTRSENLLPSDWTFRKNYFIKPVAWRTSPIVAPTMISQTLQSGGGLTVGTSYRWAIVPRGLMGNSGTPVSGERLLSNVFVPTSGNQQVNLQWNPTPDISTADPHAPSDYRVWQSTDGGSTWIGFDEVTHTGAANYSITMDDNVMGTAGTSIPSPNRWAVKNIFELKIGTRFLIEGNLFENSWEDGQEGYAFKITISNPLSSLPNLSTSHVWIRNNVIRHVGQGVNLLGTDNSTSFTIVHTVRFENNLWEDINSTTWGGPGYAFYFHKSSTLNRFTYHPQNIQIVHNTFVNPTATFLRIDDDEPPFVIEAHNWVVHSNIAHYGGAGVSNTDGFVNAETALNTNFKNLTFARNVLASGGSGTTFGTYQSANAFPTASNMSGVGFVSYNGSYSYPPAENSSPHNFTLTGASAYKNYGLDGKDAGADIAAIEAASGLDLTP